MLVALLLGILILREPRAAQIDDLFLRWLLNHSDSAHAPEVPLTIVEIGSETLADPSAPVASEADLHADKRAGIAITPLEFALFLQAALDFQPNVIAFENVLKWRERDKDQEQVFLDRAMRVPKLLLASELSDTPDPDAPWSEIRGFPQVRGKRSDLPAFSGVGRQPAEDLRLISTAGFTNLPNESAASIHVPLLFLYRGEVVPSFTLQAILLSLGITLAEVKIEIGSQISLPGNRRIPLDLDGTMRVDPMALRRAHRLSLNELLLLAQGREKEKTSAGPTTDFHDRIILARTPTNPLSPPDLFAAAIATIQGHQYLRRVSPIFDCVILLLIAAAGTTARTMKRLDLFLYGSVLTAAYFLFALAALSRWNLWLPGFLPLGGLWSAIVIAAFFRRRKVGDVANAIPPPVA